MYGVQIGSWVCFIVFYDYFMYYDLTFDLTFKVKKRPKQAKNGKKMYFEAISLVILF